MNQKNIVITIVIVLIMLGGWWYLSSSSLPTETPSAQTSNSTNNNETVRSTVALGSLATQGGNYTCTIRTIADNGNTTGVIYASNGKTRLDFRVQDTTGTVIDTHMIRDGVFAYSWVDGQGVGTKTAIKTSGALAVAPEGGVIQVNEDLQVSSECRPWAPNVAQFSPPAGIRF